MSRFGHICARRAAGSPVDKGAREPKCRSRAHAAGYARWAMAYFVTGATGFIGRRLVERLLEKRQGKVYVLVRESSAHGSTTSSSAGAWSPAPRRPSASSRSIGDLRRPLLGVEKERVAELRGKIDHFFHLAAVYDMTAPAERNTAVNVGGTHPRGRTGARGRRQAPAPRLLDRRRGRPTGACSTRTCSTRASACPRPITAPSSSPSGSCASSPTCRGACTGRAIVVGDSQTGEMDKIDGPYYFFKAIQRLRQLLPEWVPLVGLDLGYTNIVPGRLGRRRARAHRARARARRPGVPPDRPAPAARRRADQRARRGRARAALRRQHRQTDHRPAAEVAAEARCWRCRRCARRATLALRELGIPQEVLAHMELKPRFDTREADQRAGRLAARAAAAAEGLHRAPVGLLGARDGPRAAPRRARSRRRSRASTC